jgi:hypothetical protein
VCVDPRHHVEKLDLELARLVPPDAEIVRTGALPLRLTRPFGLAGDIGLRGYFHLRAALAEEMTRSRVDAVLITGSPYYPMLMAGWIRRHWNVPVVLDFQDPWVSHAGANAPRWSKAGISHRLAVALEPHAVRNASFITSVSERQNDDMAARYSWLDRTRMASIPIGGDSEDFDAVRSNTAGGQSETNRIAFTYVGTALPRSEPLFRTLFRSLAHLRAENPDLAKRLHFRFVGTSNQPNDSTTFRVRPLAESEGVADLVTEEPARVPFLDALRVLATADVILMIGSDEPHYTASKIYPGLMSGRPYVSLFHRASSSHRILSKAGGGLAFSFETHEELASLDEDLSRGIETLAVFPEQAGKANPATYAEFEASAIAAQFGRIFDQLVQPSAV